MPNVLDLFSLNGRTALVTGATRGIGQSLAIGLAEAGADIVLIQRPDSKNNETKEQIQKLGRKVVVYKADLANPEDLRGLVKRITGDGHDINILVNCGGIQRRYAAHEFPDKDWDEVRQWNFFQYHSSLTKVQVIQVNLNAVFTLSRDVGAYMLTRTPQGNPPHRGSIISIASLASFQGGIDVHSSQRPSWPYAD